MAYDAFLLVMSQLASGRKARIVIDGEVIFFETTQKKDRYLLYTKVYSGDGYLPPNVRSCVSSSGVLRWQQNGAYLKLDPLTHSVYLFEEVELPQGKYIPFKHRLEHFSQVADEWKEICRDLANTMCQK